MSSPNDPAYPCDVPRIGEEQGEFFTGIAEAMAEQWGNLDG